MDIPMMLSIQNLLIAEGIPVCVLGEVALNYYNVPRVIHDLELCVPEHALAKAGAVLVNRLDSVTSYTYPKEEVSLYNAHKVPFPRFSVTTGSGQDFISLLPDTMFGLSPISDNVVRPDTVEGAEYSNELRGFTTKPDAIGSLHFPILPAFVNGLIRSFSEIQNDNRWAMAAMAEQLVDGMDLNDSWFETHLPKLSSVDRQFAFSLISTKASRVSPFFPDWITEFIPNKEEACRIRQIPGRGHDLTTLERTPRPRKLI